MKRLSTIVLSVFFIVFAILFFLFHTSIAFALTSVTDCGVLSVENETYQISNDLDNLSFHTCLQIVANNITLDGNGKNVYQSNATNAGVAISVANVSDVWIYNLDVRSRIVQTGVGIELNKSIRTKINEVRFVQSQFSINASNSTIVEFLNNTFSTDRYARFYNTTVNSYFVYLVGSSYTLIYSNFYGEVNMSATADMAGNLTSDIIISRASIIVNDNQTYNKTLNISFSNLLTNYTSQKLVRNNSICFSPECVNNSALNQSRINFYTDRAGNFTLVDFGTTAPAVVTGLHAEIIQTNLLYWNWTNPADIDFNGTKIYLNGVNVANLSKAVNAYLATPLVHNNSYILKVVTVDYDGNSNTTGSTISTSTLADTTPPSAVNFLNASIIQSNYIYYNWTLPVDSDYTFLRIYFNGAIIVNQSNASSITMNGLFSNTTYNLTIVSYDVNGNTNSSTNISTTLSDEITSTNISSCGTIRQSGNYIVTNSTLFSNFTCIFVINTHNVTINGNGTQLQFGTNNSDVNASGIWVVGSSNVTLENFTIISNNLLNISRYAIEANLSFNISLRKISINQSAKGINIISSTDMQIEDINISYTNTSFEINGTSQNIIFKNSIIQNASKGLLLFFVTNFSLINVTIVNVSNIVINVSNVSYATFRELNMTFPSNTSNITLIDSLNTSYISNSSLLYGTIQILNISSADLSNYTIELKSGNISLYKKNISKVNFPLTLNSDEFNLTNDILLSYNNVSVNATGKPFLNVSATITFYNMEEGNPVYIMRGNNTCNLITTPACTQISSLNSQSPVFNTTRLDGEYYLRGYTLKLIYPTINEVITKSNVRFEYFVTPTFNRTILGCNLTLNGAIIKRWYANDFISDVYQSYSASNLVEGIQYNWTIYCLDNESTSISKDSSFTVSLPQSSSGVGSSSGSSGIFGAYASAYSPWRYIKELDRYEFNESQKVSLKSLDALKIRLNNNTHIFGIAKLNENNVLLNITTMLKIANSNITVLKYQQVIISNGETKQINLDDNGSMTVVITLNGIDALRANLTLTPVKIGIKSPGESQNQTESNVQVNNAITNNVDSNQYGTKTAQTISTNKSFSVNSNLIFLIVICGIIIGIGAIYYYTQILKYKKQNDVSISTKIKNRFDEIIASFMPSKKTGNQNDGKMQTNLNGFSQVGKYQLIKNTKTYEKLIRPQLPPEHSAYIESHMRAGHNLEFIEFELIQKGTPHEQAKNLINLYKIDTYVKNCILAGATKEELSAQLQKSGWNSDQIDKIFKHADDASNN